MLNHLNGDETIFKYFGGNVLPESKVFLRTNFSFITTTEFSLCAKREEMVNAIVTLPVCSHPYFEKVKSARTLKLNILPPRMEEARQSTREKIALATERFHLSIQLQREPVESLRSFIAQL